MLRRFIERCLEIFLRSTTRRQDYYNILLVVLCIILKLELRIRRRMKYMLRPFFYTAQIQLGRSGDDSCVTHKANELVDTLGYDAKHKTRLACNVLNNLRRKSTLLQNTTVHWPLTPKNDINTSIISGSHNRTSAV